MSLNRILALVVLLVACRSPQEEASTLKYGFYGDEPGLHLVYFPDGATIRICGDNRAEVIYGMNVWAKALNRSYNLIEDCQEPDLHVFGFGNPKGDCSYGHTVYALVDSHPQTITFCVTKTVDAKTKSMVHELGHSFGMCDQYGGYDKQCSHQNNLDKTSVMFAAGSLTLKKDDIDGINAYAKFIKENK